YIKLGISMREGYIFEGNQHFTDLTIAARQKVVTLRPEWGDAHYKFAEILWFSNPSVRNRFRNGGKSTAPDLDLDDPAIQQVLYELKQSWIYGATEGFDHDLYQHIKTAFPDLELTPPGTIAPPTVTLAPVVTYTVSPTASPTLLPTVSSTPIPPETSSQPPYGVLITAALGLAIILGLFAYRLKSKS
ncbi:MAG: hypothetical protein WCC12_14730, partial [Anaerolineales bacterium]